MITPEYLSLGSQVGIVSTARKISKEELQPLISLLTDWGLKVVLGKTIDADYNQFAGDDALRSIDFQEMLDNPDIKCIWCACGGYGTVKIIDNLDFTTFRKKPKWIVGYSDVTVLHSHIHNFGIETLHANMAIEILIKSESTRTTIKKALFGEAYEVQFDSHGNNLNRIGTVRGPLVGGNLSILYSLCGSPSAINTDGKVLLIEDLDEYLYHIDRMLQNLKRNGMFENLAALIVGGLNKMNDNTVPYGMTAEEIVYDVINEYEFPVCFNFPAGHINDNRALIMGREVGLNITSEKVTLKF